MLAASVAEGKFDNAKTILEHKPETWHPHLLRWVVDKASSDDDGRLEVVRCSKASLQWLDRRGGLRALLQDDEALQTALVKQSPALAAALVELGARFSRTRAWPRWFSEVCEKAVRKARRETLRRFLAGDCVKIILELLAGLREATSVVAR
jgi:hypothetical protein